MIKKMICYLLIVLMLFSFVGCNKSDDEINKNISNSSPTNTVSDISGQLAMEGTKLHVVDLNRQQENEFGFFAEYNVFVIKDIKEMKEEIATSINKSMVENYKNDFTKYFTDGITAYEITEVKETKNHTILIGTINNYKFCVFYSKQVLSAASPEVKVLLVTFVCETDGGTSYIDQVLELENV